jgi:hypothetical protein
LICFEEDMDGGGEGRGKGIRSIGEKKDGSGFIYSGSPSHQFG